MTARPSELADRGKRLRGASAAAVAAIVAAALLGASPASARTAANPILYIDFFANGTIAVQTDGGTDVGASNGAPTVIPAGYYTLVFSGPGGCSILPYFHLDGPGVSIVTNMNEGQVTRAPGSVEFLPSSTYTWSDDALPGVVYTFATSSQVVGAAPTAAAPAASAVTNAPVSSQDPVGADLTSPPSPYLGTLTGSIAKGGKVSLVYKGKSTTSLREGRYTVTAAAAAKGGFVLKPASIVTAILPVSVTSTHAISLTLTAGKWVIVPRLGGSSLSFSVH